METTSTEATKSTPAALETSEDLAFKDIPPEKFAIAVLGHNGDTKHMWDPSKPAEVEVARSTFDALKKKGYSAYHVKGKSGEQGEQMKTFDPEAGRIIMVPQMAGGQ